MPAPEGNTNRLKHGARSKRFGIVLPALRKSYPAIGGQVKQYRKALEHVCREEHGKASLSVELETALEIDTADTFEIMRRVMLKLLDDHTDMPPSQKETCLKTVGWAVKERNAAVYRALEANGKGRGKGKGKGQNKGGATPEATSWDAFDAARSKGHADQDAMLEATAGQGSDQGRDSDR